ncbi:hypothetical protein G6O67_001201 [Ophiocordyceps sinensis]|uniref:Uncharacterized protein n=2 Tax=Ophiocordyceps sinensis TaxID=72228 RepID=A0A8H4V8Z0_9HYPO|nr:hypothetical protein OCS_02303 [Ophiocordyceps sinensis CO18]KAF4512015.1 hypothetical protein G6O67_001201 [Ophiocordyceps sinensis]
MHHNYLWPNLDDKPNEPGLLPRSILGINLNVPVEYRSAPPLDAPLSPRSRRRCEQRSSGEDSVESAESDDIHHEHGFAFAQLGSLHRFDEHGNDSDSDNPPDYMAPDFTLYKKHVYDPWICNGYGVVVEVDHRGRTGAVWVIYKFFKGLVPLRDYEQRLHVDTLDDNDALLGHLYEQGQHVDTLDDNDALLDHLGRLYPDCTEQFTVAKIADSLDDLRQPREGFCFDIEARTERQIVRAKLAGPQRLVQRQYIHRSHRHAC